MLSSILIWEYMTPVQSINRNLMRMKKRHCRKVAVKIIAGHTCVCGNLYTYWDESNSVFGCGDNGSSFDFTIYWGSKV